MPGDHPNQAAMRWVSTWMGDRQSSTCTSETLSGGYFSGIVDRLLNNELYRHRFPELSLCPRTNAIQHRREWLGLHSLARRKEKKGKKGRNYEILIDKLRISYYQS